MNIILDIPPVWISTRRRHSHDAWDRLSDHLFTLATKAPIPLRGDLLFLSELALTRSQLLYSSRRNTQ